MSKEETFYNTKEIFEISSEDSDNNFMCRYFNLGIKTFKIEGVCTLNYFLDKVKNLDMSKHYLISVREARSNIGGIVGQSSLLVQEIYEETEESKNHLLKKKKLHDDSISKRDEREEAIQYRMYLALKEKFNNGMNEKIIKNGKEYEDIIYVRSVTKFDFWDRIKILFSINCITNHDVYTEKLPGNIYSEYKFYSYTIWNWLKICLRRNIRGMLR